MLGFLDDWGRSQEKTRLQHRLTWPGSARKALKSLNWAARYAITLLGWSGLIKGACRQEIWGRELANQSGALVSSISQPTAATRKATMALSPPKDGLAGHSSLLPLLFTYPILNAAQRQEPTDTSHYRSARRDISDGRTPSLSTSPAAQMTNASASRQINTTGHPSIPTSLQSTEPMVQKHSVPLRSVARASERPRSGRWHYQPLSASPTQYFSGLRPHAHNSPCDQKKPLSEAAG